MQRRQLLKAAGLFTLGSICQPRLKAQTPAPSANTLFFTNPTNEFRFLNNLGKVHYKFADLGELLVIRTLIDESQPSSAVKAYLDFALRCKTTAEDCLVKGLKISARDAFLRASTYYYAAMDFLDEAGQESRFTELFSIHRACWHQAAQLMNFDYETFDIPYEGTTIKGFLMRHKGDHSPRPLCIFNNGSDGSILDAWTMGGAGFFERGYNILTFDGPGQGSSLFEKNLFFRFDWENVLTPVIDSVIHRKEVLKTDITVLGISQAGYWVPRAAAFEKRITRIIADPGVVDVASSWIGHLPAPMVKLLAAGNKQTFNQYMEAGFKDSPASKAQYRFRARPYGKDNPYDTYKEVMKYSLHTIAANITCPALITSPENETFWPGQSQRLFDLLKSPKTLLPFNASDGADYHCEPKARVFWEQQVLDTVSIQFSKQ